MKLTGSGSILLVALAFTPSLLAQTTVFSDNFDNGLGQWTATNQWHLQSESGGQCTQGITPFPSSGYTAAFNNGDSAPSWCAFPSTPGNLTTLQPISIPAGAASARLRFKTYEATKCGYGNCGWDCRYVRVSTDGGAIWDTVAMGATELVWYERVVSLDAYRGSDVLLQFRFEPVDHWFNDYPGWFVDDVVVEVDSPFDHYCTGKISSAHCIPVVTAVGDISLSGPDDLVIAGDLLRNNVASKIIWSRTPNNAPFHGGTLCVSPPTARTTVLSSGGWPSPAANCSGNYVFPFTHAYMLYKGVWPGETLHVQVSTRDPGYAPPGNHSLSAGILFTVLP